ncbi:MAG: histidine kinase [SAR324 cluster bacterium]|nr:histidine kinase [SAR324 cluster bacterium]
MIANFGLFLLALAYFGLLFGIAYYANKQRKAGRSLINNATIYSLSFAVYCTGLTFYGNVGSAATQGFMYLPIYLGPTLMAFLWTGILRKIIRICKLYSITSIADFISSRYGNSSLLGGVVAIVAVVGILPYISLQLKAISSSFQLIVDFPEEFITFSLTFLPFTKVTTFYITTLLIIFVIAFGVRSLDATERHEGLVAAIAFESIIKLVAFISLGLFVVYGIYNGFGDLLKEAKQIPELESLWTLRSKNNSYEEWFFLSLLGMLAILLLPCQFQMAVVENVNESFLDRASWLFPLYLFLINLFVFPIALAGRLHFPNTMDADTFVLGLPIIFKQDFLVWLIFIGGLSAATSMIIVETLALSTMICNSLVVPIIISLPLVKIKEGPALNRILLFIRQGSVVLILFTSYLYFQIASSEASLVSTGLVSFLAIAQFAPSVIGGLYWRSGTRLGALFGLLAGFSIWGYTLLLSQLTQAGLFPQSILQEGLFGIEFLKPSQLFGIETMGPIAQATFWSLFFNTSLYIGISLLSPQRAEDRSQASLFIDVMRYSIDHSHSKLWKGTASTHDLRQLLERFLGKRRTEDSLQIYATRNQFELQENLQADADLVQYTENLLSGTIGSVSARIMVESVVGAEPLKMEEVMNMLDATQQVISYSQQLEEKSQQLLHANEELQKANLRLTELDTLKDDFISMITHELRTPLTSVRAFSEIIYHTPDLERAQREEFLAIVIKETERLTRLINHVLDFEKLDSKKMKWNMEPVEIQSIIENAITTTSQLAKDKNIEMLCNLPDSHPKIFGDHDRLTQVMINLLSNAVKFCPEEGGKIWITLNHLGSKAQVLVRDNGVGIQQEDQEHIFEKFRQVQNPQNKTYSGSGLGLSISKNIIEYHNGRIGVASGSEKGAIFYFTLPLLS